MKRLLFIFLALAGFASAQSGVRYLGDINGDGVVNVADVSQLIQDILEPEAYMVDLYDLNGDNQLNVADVTQLINIILNGELIEIPQRLAGGDISLLLKYEENGALYYGNWQGQQQQVTNMLNFYEQIGFNAMRVRLFVNPENTADRAVCQDLEYVKQLGKKIKDAGMKFIVDYHYSDTWADPGQQTMPARWAGLSGQALADTVYNYTRTTLLDLVAAGAAPDLVQVGNETTYGMLWPSGHTWPSGADYSGGTWDNFQSYFNAGARAVREVLPKAKVICHVELSKSSNALSFFSTARDRGLDYDVIGLSYYPAYHATASTVITTIDKVITNIEAIFPNHEIMIMETGYSYAWAMNDTKDTGIENYYPYTEAGQEKFVADLTSCMKQSHPNVQGIFWWWPEQNEYGLDWNTKRVTDGWWNASLVDSRTGKILNATYTLAQFPYD